MLREADPLGDVLLEHEPEATPLLQPIDLDPKVGAQRRVLDLVEKDVEFASDHRAKDRRQRPARLATQSCDDALQSLALGWPASAEARSMLARAHDHVPQLRRS